MSDEITEIDKAIFLMAQRAGRDPMTEALRFQTALNDVRASELYQKEYDARAHQACYP